MFILTRNARATPFITCFILLLFWAIGLAQLDTTPILHNDEVSILAAGWQLFARGQYGLAMYTGFYEQERLYLEIMPLMSLLQGAGSVLWGVGVFQMRFLPVVYGMLTLALTFQLGKMVANATVGLWAAILLIGWQWAAPTPPFLLSGIPLVDLARLGRYDILIAPLSLLILLFFLRRQYALCGICLGLSLLTHLYVIFWPPILVILWWVITPRRIRHLMQIALSALLTVAPWIVIMVRNWPQTQGQMGKHSGRFSIGQLAFYVTNVQTEVQRYHLGLRDPATALRIGFWLFVIGVPLALLALLWSKSRFRWAIVIPTVVFPLAFALLISKKNLGYLLAFMPILTVAVAWQLTNWWQHIRRSRPFIALLLIGTIMQGMFAIAHAQQTATATPHVFFHELRQAVPPNSIVMAPQTYWIGLADTNFRSFYLPFVRAQPTRSETISFRSALDAAQPTIFITTPILEASFKATAAAFPTTSSYRTQFNTFLQDYDAQLITTLVDHEGLPVEIYQLSP